MVNSRYANAMAEVLYYLKGISQEKKDMIPKKFLLFLEENASKDYKCDFDYRKPLKELNLLDETRGLIGMICLNYWCDTEEKKEMFIKKMDDNEKKYQEELRKKYDPDNIFKSTIPNETEKTLVDNIAMVEYKEPIFKRIINKIKEIFHI